MFQTLSEQQTVQETAFAEVTPPQPVCSGNVAVTVRISRVEADIHNGADASTRLARHKRFGASSEKISEDAMEQLSFLFNEAEVCAEEGAEEPVTSVAAHKRHKKHHYTLDNIPEGTPTEVVEHRLEGEDLVCPECGDTMTES